VVAGRKSGARASRDKAGGAVGRRRGHRDWPGAPLTGPAPHPAKPWVSIGGTWAGGVPDGETAPRPSPDHARGGDGCCISGGTVSAGRLACRRVRGGG